MQEYTMRFEMFGGLKIWLNDQCLVTEDDRLNKNIELLVLLALFREQGMTNGQLMEALWEPEEIQNPAGALKNAAYSLRKWLQVHSDFHFIVVNEKNYQLNPDIRLEIDFHRMAELACELEQTPDAGRLELCFAMLQLYQGDFLPELSSRSWTAAFSDQARKTYLMAANLAAEYLLERQNRADAAKALEIANRATLVEPYNQRAQVNLFRAMRALEMKSAVVRQYPIVTDLFFNRTGTALPGEVLSIYQWAMDTTGHAMEDMLRIRQDLNAVSKNDRPGQGAYWCTYDFFKQLYDMASRLAVRNDQHTLLMLTTLYPPKGQNVSRDETAHGMLVMRDILYHTLRKGDVYCRYSRNQYVIMMLVTSLADSHAVEKRIRQVCREKGIEPAFQLDITTSKPDPIVSVMGRSCSKNLIKP